MISLGITTFCRRYEMLEKMIENIKRFSPDVEIILIVNADYRIDFNEQYRKNILGLCERFTKIYPVIFPQFTGLSKMWNTIVLNATNEYICILNDDLDIRVDIVAVVEKIISEMKKPSDLFVKVNNSFSHFICTKKVIDDLGYFDERLLAFGEEDGDMTWRYIKKFRRKIKSVDIEGINNIGEGYMTPHPNMKLKEVNQERLVPAFNRNFIFHKKYGRSIWGIRGMFPWRMRQKLSDKIQYPYEKFKRKHFDSL